MPASRRPAAGRWKVLAPAILQVIVPAMALAACLSSCSKSPERLAADDPAAAADRGKTLVSVYACATCHRISGVRGGPGTIGPPLTGWAGRRYIAGAIPNEPRLLALWLRNPQEVEPGTAMPDLGISEAEALDMAAYLFSQ